MEKVIFRAPDSDESVEFYVVEQTKINGSNYLLVSVEEDGDSDAFILRDVSTENEEDSVYEMVESEEELEYMSKIFTEILEDVDIAF